MGEKVGREGRGEGVGESGLVGGLEGVERI